MQLSLNWLKEFVEIPKNVSPEQLGEKLTMHTVEVEKIARQADKYRGVVVGKILQVKPHPNADRLRLALVDVGSEKLEIVCGASNIKPGQFAPVALIGTILPGMSAKGGSASGGEIKPVEIRGVKSSGMLCAADELGWGKDHSEIVILGKTPLNPPLSGGKTPPLPPLIRGVKAGQSLAEYLKLDDVIFEVDNKSITHRGDLWSHYGLARDISAFLNVKFKEIKTPLIPLYKGDKPLNPPFKRGAGGLHIKVKVEDHQLCPRYMALAMTGIKVALSPKWLAQRLEACGMRPINNIVDATNYVMLELGQPLHAFDFFKIKSEIPNPKSQIPNKNAATIIVRKAKQNETIETLDGQIRKLEPDMLVIADQVKPVAIAGIMGGAESEINQNTASIIIEAANFNAVSVRRTAQKLGLRTEASVRFEKGQDPNLCELGLYRAQELIKKLCPGAAAVSEPADVKKYKLDQGPIKLDLAWLNNFIGHEFTIRQVKQILEKLGFGVKEKRQVFSITIPSWRAVNDVSLKQDLAEEVARIYGYNNIKAALPKVNAAPPEQDQERILIRKIKNILSAGAGLTEVYNYSFLSEKQAANATPLNPPLSGGTEAIKLANPLSEDLAALRPSLIPGLLGNIKTNQAQEEKIGLFEIGRIFLNRPGEASLPFQEKRLGLLLAETQINDLLRKLKGVIEYLLSELNLQTEFDAAGGINAAGQTIGRLAELENNLARAYGIKKAAALAEISLPKLLAAVKNAPARQYEEPAKYPAVGRDLAFVVNEKILYNNIVKDIKNFSALIKQAELFDVYQGDKLGAGKKSLAFHVIYQADRTLTSAEVDEAQGKLVKHLEKEFGAKIRDF